MREAQLRDAKASFSAVVDQAYGGEPTVVTKHGEPRAVVVGYNQWLALQGQRPTFVELLLSFPDVGDIARDTTPPRQIDL